MEPIRIPADALQQHGRFVRALALRLLDDPHEAEDVAQEAWLRFLQSPPRRALDPRGWFAAVTRNLASNTRRAAAGRAARRDFAADERTAPSADAEIVAGEVVRSVGEAVATLHEPYRSTVLARYYHGWEPSRIARETGVPVATVKSRLQRAHAMLRERLDREHGSRESWAIALAPLAALGRGPGPLAQAAGLTIAAVALTGVGVVAAGALRPRPPATPEVPEGSSSAAAGGANGRGNPISAESSREAVDAPKEARTQRFPGLLRNRPYAPLALAGGPAARVPLRIRVLESLEWGSDVLAEAAATTGELGRFTVEFAQAPPAPAALVVTAPEDDTWRALSYRRDVVDWAEIGELELVRSAHGAIEGLVVDSDGAPAANARLRVLRQGAEPIDEVVESDGAGRIRTGARGSITEVRASDPGSTVIDWDRERHLDEGGANGWRVVLGRSAALEVRCVDDQGNALEGIRVRARLDECEERELGNAEGEGLAHDARTGADGSARFERVGAGRKIAVTLDDGNRSWSSSAVRGDELVWETGEVASPLVLSAGETRRLVARFEGLVVRGRVSERDGRGVPDADVSVLQAAEAGRHESALASFRSGPDGAFEQRLRAPILRRSFRVVARREREAPPSSPALADLGSPAGLPSAAAASATVDGNGARDGVLEVEIVLDPLLAISGRLLDPQGRGIGRGGLGGVRLWATPSGASSHRDAGDLGEAGVELRSDGRFEISGLRRGPWDLHVSEEIRSFYTWESFVHRFPSIDAGSAEVELRLERQEPVRIRIRTRGGEPDGLTVLHAKLFPRDPDLPRATAPRSIRVEGVAGWPVDALVDFGGISGASDELGIWSHGFYGTDEVREHALQPFGPGWYVIGIHPSARDGEVRWFPQATELLWFEPGEHEIDFDLVATTTLAGVVRGAPADERIAVELRTLAGQRIPLERRPGSARPSAGLEVDARGRFTVRHAPVGRHRLRAGTLAGLARGEARREVEVELSAGEAGTVELSW